MEFSKKKVVKRIDLRDYGILDLDPDSIDLARGLIAELLVAEINGTMDESRSPVSGGKWKSAKKDGSTSVLLEDGDLRDAIEARIKGNFIDVGVFDEDQAPKAYAHNTGYKGHEHIPNGKYFRQFIPEEDQSFTRDIESSIRDVIKSFKGNKKAQEKTEKRFTINDALNVKEVKGAPEKFTVADILGDLFGED